MKLITADELRELADGIDNQNYAAEFAQAVITIALKNMPSPPDLGAHSGPCCSELVDGVWLSTGCDCRNSGDTEEASDWRMEANRYQAVLKLMGAA